jgi:tubulin beta
MTYPTNPNPNTKTSAVMLWNTTAIKHVFERISEKFYSLYKKKAFVHQYVNEGVDEMELAGAMEKVNDLSSGV